MKRYTVHYRADDTVIVTAHNKEEAEDIARDRIEDEHGLYDVEITEVEEEY